MPCAIARHVHRQGCYYAHAGGELHVIFCLLTRYKLIATGTRQFASFATKHLIETGVRELACIYARPDEQTDSLRNPHEVYVERTGLNSH